MRVRQNLEERNRVQRIGALLLRLLVFVTGPFVVNPAGADVVGPGFLGMIPPGHVEPLRFGALLSFDVGAGPEDVTNLNSGFDVTEARLSVAGRLEKGFGYFVQANFVDSPPLLDLVLDWASDDCGFRASTGYFRTPFSAEFQIPAQNLDFIERSQIVRAVAPGRQIGIELSQQVLGDALVVRAGAFNGNGLDTNDDQRFLYVVRFEGRIDFPNEQTNRPSSWLEYGMNGGYSKDRDASFGDDLPDDFEGTRWLSGADLRWTRGNLFLSAEGIYASIDPVGSTRRDVYGYQASVGWTITPLVQILARYDSLWAGSLASDQDLAIGSMVLNFTQYFSLQFEVRVPVRGEPLRPGGLASLNAIF